MKNLLLTLFSFSLLFSNFVSSNEDGQKKQILIIAKVEAAKLLRDNTNQVTVMAPATYSVKLGKIKVIQGDSNVFPKTLRLILDANHLETLINNDRIFVLLDLSEKQPKVIYWNVVRQIACIPENLIDSRYDDVFFKYQWQDDPIKKCTATEKYRPPRQD